MAVVTLGGNPIHTNGELPAVGSKAADFNLIKKIYTMFLIIAIQF